MKRMDHSEDVARAARRAIRAKRCRACGTKAPLQFQVAPFLGERRVLEMKALCAKCGSSVGLCVCVSREAKWAPHERELLVMWNAKNSGDAS